METSGSAYPVSSLDTDRGLDELAASIVAGAGRLAAATCEWLIALARFDTAGGYMRAGFVSTAAWLSFACGLAGRTARDHVQVAHALTRYPLLATEMSAGRLSYSHLRTISRIAAGGEHDDGDEPELIAQLVEIARHGTVAHLETIVRGLRTVDETDNHHPADRTERERLTHSFNLDSTWRLSARLDPERGALVTAALTTLARDEQIGAADALVRLAEIALAALADRANPPRPLRGDEHAAVLVHLDANKIPDSETPGGGSAEPPPWRTDADRRTRPTRPYARIANGPGLPDRVVKRLLCAGRIRTVVRDGANVLNLGRSHRLVTDRQYQALLIRQHGHCAHPGCTHTKNLHAHHRIHWIDGGRTDLDNLILVCEPHHLAHHNGEFTLEASCNGRLRFLDRHGNDIDPALPGVDPDTTVRLRNRYAHLDPLAATTRWDGQHLNRRYALTVISTERNRQRQQSVAV